MPLSEHEQRILEEIERGLAADDPRLVEQVERSDLHGHLVRRVRWAIAGFIAGCVLLLLFVVSPWVAAAGFVLMVLSALVAVRSLGRLGREQISKAPGPDAGGVRGSVTGTLGRMLGRLRREPGPPPEG